MTATATYDPNNIAITLGPILCSGFVDGDYVSAERAEDTFSARAGADGLVTRTHNRNAMGTVTVTLMAESPTNDLLTALFEEDEVFHTGVRPLTIKDLFGNTLVFAEEAWVQKPPAITYGKESGERQWVITCANLTIHAGGGIAISL
jgi:hypothetical protein